ncbi:NYN domain-containing protein [Massilia sp. DWR3-1-1]|uniref:NYN domain-containing protein n=1 Tax=Massilia sp. DWR3-1-1 TaxID=2804559 RepID=UPI003CF70967
MASTPDNISMAVFCDFENVALGVRDANYEKFDIKPVLERLLLKGSIVVKKAYCDWERYKGFKATMHEANFELIEIPHVRQSGKNSADIRLVVDALDLCYTKSHVNTFVIISGDSDFSPLVSKLRENNKQVIGVGVKQSTSDLLVANCDEFIFYDDLVREVKRAAAKRDERKSQPAQVSSSGSGRRAPDDKNDKRKEELESRKAQAIDMVVEMFDALVSERGDSGKIWASLLKDTLKRRRPEFNETYFGFRTFGNLLEEAQARGMLEFGRDEKSGAYVYRSAAGQAVRSADARVELEADNDIDGEQVDLNGGGTANDSDAISPEMAALLHPTAPLDSTDAVEAAAPVTAGDTARRPARPEPARGRGRGRGRTDFRAPVSPQAQTDEAPFEAAEAAVSAAPVAVAEVLDDAVTEVVADSVADSVADAVSREAAYEAAEQAADEAAEHAAGQTIDPASAHSDSAEWNEDSPFPPPAAEKRRNARAPARKGAASKGATGKPGASKPGTSKGATSKPGTSKPGTSKGRGASAPKQQDDNIGNVAASAERLQVDGNIDPAPVAATPARKAPARSRRPAKPKADQ